MRTEKELFELMLEHQDLFESGLCDWTLDMWHYNIINVAECHLLEDYLYENKPENAGKFWWTRHELQPRLDWINKQIKKL